MPPVSRYCCRRWPGHGQPPLAAACTCSYRRLRKNLRRRVGRRGSRRHKNYCPVLGTVTWRLFPQVHAGTPPRLPSTPNLTTFCCPPSPQILRNSLLFFSLRVSPVILERSVPTVLGETWTTHESQSVVLATSHTCLVYLVGLAQSRLHHCVYQCTLGWLYSNM